MHSFELLAEEFKDVCYKSVLDKSSGKGEESMFFKKDRQRVEALEQRMDWHVKFAHTCPESLETIDCEECGCLVKKENAVKGKGEVRERDVEVFVFWQAIHDLPLKEEFLYTPYFCKRCAPKEKKKAER